MSFISSVCYSCMSFVLPLPKVLILIKQLNELVATA